MHTHFPLSLRSPRALSQRLCSGGVLLFLCVGCATTSKTDAERHANTEALLERVEEVERTNSRITVRMEELEEELFLLNDRVESHRLALQRRSYEPRARSSERSSPQALQPAPESSYYVDRSSARSPVHRATPQRPIQRIQLEQPSLKPQPVQAPEHEVVPGEEVASSSDEEAYEDVVISEEEYRAFFGDPKPSSGGGTSAPASSSRRPQPPVTSEKLLSTTRARSPQGKRETLKGSKSQSSGIRLYKESLSQYRAGDYRPALDGFSAFLSSKPKRDYVDNALYWIGECHYGLGDYSKAIRYFERVLDEQPEGNKVPDAMLKMSLALEKSGRHTDAESLMRDLVEEYPHTHAAALGQKRLDDHQK